MTETTEKLPFEIVDGNVVIPVSRFLAINQMKQAYACIAMSLYQYNVPQHVRLAELNHQLVLRGHHEIPDGSAPVLDSKNWATELSTFEACTYMFCALTRYESEAARRLSAEVAGPEFQSALQHVQSREKADADSHAQGR